MAECGITTCPHESAIARLTQQDSTLVEMLRDVRDDMKEVKATVQIVKVLELENKHTKETLGRAFTRIEALEAQKAATGTVSEFERRLNAIETSREAYDAFINQFKGASRLAWLLWTVMAGGLGVVIFKLFLMSGAAS